MAAGRPPDRRDHAGGDCEFIGEYANPFTLFVIADLLGVPEEEHEEFRAALARRPNNNAVGSTKDHVAQPTGVALRAFQRLHRGPSAHSPATTC